MAKQGFCPEHGGRAHVHNCIACRDDYNEGIRESIEGNINEIKRLAKIEAFLAEAEALMVDGSDDQHDTKRIIDRVAERRKAEESQLDSEVGKALARQQ